MLATASSNVCEAVGKSSMNIITYSQFRGKGSLAVGDHAASALSDRPFDVYLCEVGTSVCQDNITWCNAIERYRFCAKSKDGTEGKVGERHP